MSLSFKSNSYLEKLDSILNFDLSTKLPSSILIFQDAIAQTSIALAIISFPYVLYLLFRLKKYGWIIFFFIFVFTPTVFFHYLLKNTEWLILANLSLLLFLGIYLFLLKLTSNDWKEPNFVDYYRKRT